jgi:hypothetical protein
MKQTPREAGRAPTAAPRARDAPASVHPPLYGALFVDMENVRARYECLRRGCANPFEGPVYGVAEVQAFTQVVSTHHLLRCTALEIR